MKVLKFTVIILIICSCSKNLEIWEIKDSNNSEEISEKVALVFEKLLDEDNPKIEYIIGNWNKNKYEQHFKYLGDVETNKKLRLKVVISKLFVGDTTKRGISRVFVLDSLGIIGSYFIPDIRDLPQKMENGILFFKNENNNCIQATTTVDFRNGIPQKIFRKCNGKYGDLYEFQYEE